MSGGRAKKLGDAIAGRLAMSFAGDAEPRSATLGGETSMAAHRVSPSFDVKHSYRAYAQDLIRRRPDIGGSPWRQRAY